MFDLDSWQEIWITITKNKTRSIMTGFGVFWGIFMLIVLTGLGNGLRDGILSQVDGFSPNSVFFSTQRTSEAHKGFRKGRAWGMNSKDLKIIQNNASSVDKISPMQWGPRGTNNVVRGVKAGSYSTRGVYPAQFEIENVNLLSGRLFNDLDVEHKRKVVIIGNEVYETLFNIGEDAIGEYLRVSGIYFQIIGVISRKANVSVGGRVEEAVLLPFTTLQQTFMRGDEFWFITCTAKKGYTGAMVEQEVTALLKDAHDIAPTDKKAVWSMNIENQVKLIGGLIAGVEVLIWFVGMGALLSGVFGISNIMLVTVRERMREIGVRRALGAKPMNIMVQIMSESLVLTMIAGLIGFVLGVGIVVAMQSVMEMGASSGPSGFKPPSISFNMALISMFVLVLSGLLAGILPTLRALQVKAIDAIQDE